MNIPSSALVAALAAIASAQSAKLVSNSTISGNGPITSAIPPLGVVMNFGNHGTPPKGVAELLSLKPKAQKLVQKLSKKHGGLQGQIVLNEPITGHSLSSDSFAFTNCAESHYTGNIGLSNVVQNAISAKVRAIIFYTTNLDGECELEQAHKYGDFIPLFTMVHPHQARQILADMNKPKYRPRHQTISTYDTYVQWANNHNPNGFGPLGGAGSTAVAMIILYSITGVITALFLIIIITGAIRAHRHPERYGPRTVLGRPRQSRAKGIARAMLDTIPIVKFGERLPDPSKDVETGSSIAMERQLDKTTGPSVERDDTQATAGASEQQQEASSSSTAAAVTTTTTAAAAAAPSVESSSEKSPQGDDEGLGCSICTEDFERGQDIRVLPCNHKFHPACVDPWLLDVSGTCPLCRVDLNPGAANQDGQEGSSELPPPLDPTSEAAGAALGPGFMRRRDTIRGFVATRLNRRGLQGTSREERLEILRRWRETHTSQSGSPVNQTATTTDATQDDANDTEERQSRLSRFSRLVRRRG